MDEEDDDIAAAQRQIRRQQEADRRLAKAGAAANAALSVDATQLKNRLNAMNECLAAAERASITARQHIPTLAVQRTPDGSSFALTVGSGNLRGHLRFIPDRRTGMVQAFADITVDGKTRPPHEIGTVDPLNVEPSIWTEVVADFLDLIAKR